MTAAVQSRAWWPAYGVFVAALTLTPGLTTLLAQPLEWELRGLDFVLNVALFAPLGVVARRLPVAALLVAALLLSGAIEAVQVVLPRGPNGLDVVANVSGAAAGRLWLGPPRIPVWSVRGRWAVAIAALATIAALGAGAARLEPNDFSNWQRYSLIAGNELTRDRAWQGTIHELAVFDRAIEPGERDLESWRWAEGGPVVWIRLEAPVRGRVDGPDGERAVAVRPTGPGLQLEPRGLVFEDGAWVLPSWVADAVRERLVATGRLSVVASVSAARLDAFGPPRILSLSRDPWLRDFTLAQSGAGIELRVRTPNTNDNATDIAIDSRDAPLDRSRQRVLASFDGVWSRIYVDGAPSGELLFPLRTAPWPLGGGIALSIAVSCMAAALAGAAAFPGRGRAVVAGGALGWGMLWGAGVWDHWPGYGAVAAAIGVVSVAAVLPLARALEMPGRGDGAVDGGQQPDRTTLPAS